MKCPHCLTSFHENWDDAQLRYDGWLHVLWYVSHLECPECNRPIIQLEKRDPNNPTIVRPGVVTVYPKARTRPVPIEVGEPYGTDFKEACAVIADSPKASAALSRRLLQHIIHEKAGIKRKDLATEIQELIDSGKLPTQLSDAIDGVRNIGNFAAHPIKSTNTGEIVDVEDGEAEWLLETIEGFFDFYFVQPTRLKKKKDALNRKLADAGKPPMK